MTDYESINEITSENGENAIDKMISNASNSNQYDIYKSTFSTTEIAKECENVDTANQLNFLLKNINILTKDGKLSKFSIDNGFGLIYQGINKKGEKYSQIRYTQKGNNYILKSINQDTTNTKKIKDAEIRYIHKKNDPLQDLEFHAIIAFADEDKNIIYELNQKIKSYKVAQELIIKITNKSVIDLKYWTCRTIKDLDNSNITYWSNSDLYLDFSNDCCDDFDNNYYDDSEEGETKRMINDVSRQLGYDVDEDLARAFIHDMSRD